MRLIAGVLAGFLIICEATSASESDHTMAYQTAGTDNTQPTDAVENSIASKRFLRADVVMNRGVERIFEALKNLLPGAKIVAKDGASFSGTIVRKMLGDKAFRKQEFERWIRSDIDGTALRQMLGDMNKKGRAELLNRYTAFLGSKDGLVYYKPGPIA
ncbi:secreted RxLR effector peptide protein, putative [Phytophthora infestans T30-4]|uniref:RxLR effector protein n=1 Tax=Phytophthora infestans (strain T30-4) TaxID=403677 RepID=D0N0I7_PHYIT|nr:secreted RxLR effector peptide protein, putative [Phytophthora infestans T30-4]EEY67150.1 secreted RxLR effector peptide protein, putative [Phytophthora infestans T30-4]|eukprot:XP_002905798.1 secreted RxLR effector peptide protein, putative [Phytophthora infestans T30-4]